MKHKLGKMIFRCYKILFRILLSIMPKDDKLVIFESFHGKQYSDNPRAIYEYMRKYFHEYRLCWSADRRYLSIFSKRDIKYTKRFSIKWIFVMVRAKYWVTNSRLPLWIPKSEKVTYLQTWHGTPLKKLATDMDEVHMPDTNIEKYKRNFLVSTSKWDYLVSPNEYSTDIFRRAFQFDRKFIESGYPRNDILINCNDKKTTDEIKSRCGLPKDKRIILYAPTWRDNQFYTKGEYKFSLEMDLNEMKEQLGDKYIILLRLHYLVAENLDLTNYNGFVYDFTSHEDIRELYLISDMLITDYSSVFFDYAILKRPMVFFVYDIEEYRDNLRGFYFDFESEAPGPLVKSTNELIEVIKEIEPENFMPSERTKRFYERFCYLEDGHASERVVNEVFVNNYK